jgi:hypothetical protein
MCFFMGNKKKYLVAAQHFGAANATIPVAKELRKCGDEVVYLAHNQAEIKCKELRFLYETSTDYGVSDELASFDVDSMGNVLEAVSPDCVLTGSSTERKRNGLEKSLILASQRRGIPTVMVVDLWPETDIRFKDYFNPESLIIPGKVCVIDDEGKRLVTAEGVPADKVFVTGNPYFDMGLKEYQGFGDGWKTDVRSRVGMNAYRPLMFYAGNASREEEGDFCDFDNIRAINEMLKSSSFDLSVGVRLHGRMPVEEVGEISSYLAENGDSNLTLLPGDNPSNRHLVFASDIIATPTSTDGVTAASVGKPVLSMTGTEKRNFFFPSSIGVAHRVENYLQLSQIVSRLLGDSSYKYTLCPNLRSFVPDGKAVERILDVIKA